MCCSRRVWPPWGRSSITGPHWRSPKVTMPSRKCCLRFGLSWLPRAPIRASAAYCLYLEPFPAYRLRRMQRLRRAFEHDAPVAHDVESMGKVERDGKLLLDQKDGNATTDDLRQQIEHQLDH